MYFLLFLNGIIGFKLKYIEITGFLTFTFYYLKKIKILKFQSNIMIFF